MSTEAVEPDVIGTMLGEELANKLFALFPDKAQRMAALDAAALEPFLRAREIEEELDGGRGQ